MIHYPLAIGLQGPELWFILALVLILFGAKKIPELFRSAGQSVGEFQKGINESKKAIEDMKNAPSATTPTPTDDPSTVH